MLVNTVSSPQLRIFKKNNVNDPMSEAEMSPGKQFPLPLLTFCMISYHKNVIRKIMISY